MVAILLNAGAYPDLRDSNGGTPLYFAATTNRVESAKVLISAGANVNSADNMGRAPLYCAAQNCHAEIAKLLIDSGASLDVTDYMGWTPLHIACYKLHLEMARLLLRYGADCTIKNNSSQYAFDLIANSEEQQALQRQQCWRDRRGIILLQSEVSESLTTSVTRHRDISVQVKVLRNVDVFRFIVKFL
jgi:ankyrin repeat protein